MFFVTDVHCFQLEDEAITKSENAKITISSFIQILLIIARNVGMKLKFEVIESLICMMTYVVRGIRKSWESFVHFLSE